MLFVTANLSPHLDCKYSSFTGRANDSTASKLVVPSHDEAAVFPTISSTSQLCRAGMGPVQDPLLYPPSLLPRLLHRAWQLAALFVLPSYPLFLPSVLCLPGFSLFLLFASIISLLASPFSFLLHTCLQGFPSIATSPSFLSISTILFPFPLSVVLSCSFPLPSQLQLELIRYLSSSAKLLVAPGSSQEEVSRAGQLGFSMQPPVINTITNVGRWAHFCPWPSKQPWLHWESHSGIQHGGSS